MENRKYTFEEVVEKMLSMLNDAGRTGGFCDGIACHNCPFKRKSTTGKYMCNCEDILQKPSEFVDFVMNYEPEVDWSKVAIDTPILVKDYEYSEWKRRHFARYENGEVFAYKNGATSFSAENDNSFVFWNYAKLYKPESEVEHDRC